MYLSRSEVLTCLEAVRGAVAEKPLVPILTHVLFQNDTVLAYDGEIGIRTKMGSPVEKPFNVKHSSFYGLVKSLEDEDMEVTVTDRAVKVKCGRHSSTLNMLAEDFPKPQVVAKPEDWREVPAGFKEACERASIAIANDEANRALSAVFVEGDFVYGCDGRRSVRCKVAGLGVKAMLITKKTVREVVKLGNPKRMAVRDSMVLFDYSNLMLLARLREAADFPARAIDGMFGKRKANAVIPDGFGRALSRLSMFAGAMPRVNLDNDGMLFSMSAEGPAGSAVETLPKFEETIPKRGISPDLCAPFLPYAELVHFGSAVNDPYYFNGETAGFEALLMPMS